MFNKSLSIMDYKDTVNLENVILIESLLSIYRHPTILWTENRRSGKRNLEEKKKKRLCLS